MYRSLVILIIFFVQINLIIAQQKYQLVETGTEASCFYYKVADGKGFRVNIPIEIDSALSCPSALLGISPDCKYLIYVWGDLKQYDFTTKKISLLLTMGEPSEGFSNIIVTKRNQDDVCKYRSEYICWRLQNSCN